MSLILSWVEVPDIPSDILMKKVEDYIHSWSYDDLVIAAEDYLSVEFYEWQEDWKGREDEGLTEDELFHIHRLHQRRVEGWVYVQLTEMAREALSYLKRIPPNVDIVWMGDKRFLFAASMYRPEAHNGYDDLEDGDKVFRNLSVLRRLNIFSCATR